MGLPRATAAKTAYKYEHKLFEPRALQGAVPREPLLNRIFGSAAPRVVLVQAPAGHGKTTLLQQAMAECRARDMVTGWLSMDEADNDLRRLSMHLQALASGMASLVRGDTARKSSSSAAEPPPSRAEGLIAQLNEFTEPVALFLDDFHALSGKPVLAFFRDLVERLPTRVRLFIGSRSVPELGLARRVVSGEALILHAEELRFSFGEVRQFFAEAQDLAVGEDELAAIHRKTEGWPAALQLFRLSLASPEVRRSLTDVEAHRPRELAEYLADNVLALQEPEVQAFLLHTAPLRRLSGPLCDALLGRHDSQALLLRLERAGLFVRSMDAGHRWFAYHALFKELIEEQLRAEAPQALRQTHANAAAWFRRHGMSEDAFQHAIAAGDYALAADVLDTWSSRLIALGHLVTVESGYEALPLDEIAKRPELVVKVAWALCFLRRHQKLRPVVNMLRPLRGKAGRETHPDIVASMLAVLDDDIPACRDIVRGIEVHGRDVEGFSAFEFGAAANLRAFLELASNQIDEAQQDLVIARGYGDRAEAGFSLGYSISMMSMVMMVRGLLPEALDLLREGLSLPWMRLDDSVSSAVISACQVQALYEAGELDAATAHFEQTREVIAQFALLDYIAVAYIAMSRAHELRGRPEQALDLLEEAENLGHTRLWPRLVHLIGWERVRRLLVRGELERAQAAVSRIVPLDTPPPDGWTMYSEDTADDLIGQARLDIHRGRVDSALLALEPALRRARAHGRVHRQIKLGVLKALAERASGRDETARADLALALDLARPGGYLRCVLDEGREVVALLRQLRAMPAIATRLAFIDRLLDAAGARPSASQGAGMPPFETLTDREKKILVLLADGASNDDIATQLFVSRNTVKFHLKNIYAKLGANSRLQAINTARGMGLVR